MKVIGGKNNGGGTLLHDRKAENFQIVREMAVVPNPSISRTAMPRKAIRPKTQLNESSCTSMHDPAKGKRKRSQKPIRSVVSRCVGRFADSGRPQKRHFSLTYGPESRRSAAAK